MRSSHAPRLTKPARHTDFSHHLGHAVILRQQATLKNPGSSILCSLSFREAYISRLQDCQQQLRSGAAYPVEGKPEGKSLTNGRGSSLRSQRRSLGNAGVPALSGTPQRSDAKLTSASNVLVWAFSALLLLTRSSLSFRCLALPHTSAVTSLHPDNSLSCRDVPQDLASAALSCLSVCG